MITVSYREQGIHRDYFTQKEHSHSFYEVFQSLTDNGFFIINSKLYPLEMGALYFINRFTVHSTNPAQPQSYMRNKLSFTDDLAKHLRKAVGDECFLNDLFVDKIFIRLQKKDWDECDRLFGILNGYDGQMNFTVLKTLFDIFEIAFENTANYESNSNPYINATLSYIENHYAENINIGEIAKELFISQYYLCRLFKTHTGLTIGNYLLNYRMSAAKKLLSETNCKIVNIAAETGFTDCSYFCKLFLKYEHVTPTEYRKRQQFHKVSAQAQT